MPWFVRKVSHFFRQAMFFFQIWQDLSQKKTRSKKFAFFPHLYFLFRHPQSRGRKLKKKKQNKIKQKYFSNPLLSFVMWSLRCVIVLVLLQVFSFFFHILFFILLAICFGNKTRNSPPHGLLVVPPPIVVSFLPLPVHLLGLVSPPVKDTLLL